MNLKVNYEELLETGKFVIEIDAEIQQIFNELKNIINSVSSSWSGNDSDTFIEEANKYIDEQMENRKKIELLGNLIVTLSNNYKNKDNEFLNTVKKGEID
ncbi:MAG: WXG100 family type VII secretion target [Bacilli bacterium]|nr:WXG100 family type VII secretion target [Bacilli bacterium]